MSDLIERQAAIDAVQKYKYEHGYDYADCACDIEKDLKALPSGEAIPVAGLEKQAKWFESMDNAFAKIEANNIRVMIKKWRAKDDNRRYDLQTGGD